MKYRISSDGDVVEFEEYTSITDNTAYICVAIADMRTILGEMELKSHAKNMSAKAIDSCEIDGVHYVAVPEPPELCSGCAFISHRNCSTIGLPPCTNWERPDRKGIIWKAQ